MFRRLVGILKNECKKKPDFYKDWGYNKRNLLKIKLLINCYLNSPSHFKRRLIKPFLLPGGFCDGLKSRVINLV